MEKLVEKRRVQLDFSDRLISEMDDLQARAGFSTRSELIRHALRLLQWTITEVYDKDGTLIIEREGRQREVLIPFWATGQQAAGPVPESEDHDDSTRSQA